MKRRFFSFFIILLLITFPNVSWAETWYVKSSKTKMTQKPSPRSKKVAVLSAGTPVKILKKGKRFFNISTNGKNGWVFKFKLTNKKPSGVQGGGGLDGLLGNQKIAAAESSSGSSIRGLSPISEKHAKAHGVSEENIKAVQQMEEYSISANELDQFLSEGKLREYAE